MAASLMSVFIPVYFSDCPGFIIVLAVETYYRVIHQEHVIYFIHLSVYLCHTVYNLKQSAVHMNTEQHH